MDMGWLLAEMEGQGCSGRAGMLEVDRVMWGFIDGRGCGKGKELYSL